MRRDEAIAALRGHLPTIRRDFGVRRIALFGSTARDDAREEMIAGAKRTAVTALAKELGARLRNLGKAPPAAAKAP